MNKSAYTVEKVSRKIEDLDSELNAFLVVIEEIKEIRNAVGALPEKIKHNEEAIENQKKELKRLMSSTNDFIDKSTHELERLISSTNDFMNASAHDFERVNKKIEDLDGELNAFLVVIEEIKGIRNAVGALPEKIKYNEKATEEQRKELDRLLSSTNSFLTTIENKTNGAISDVEKKTNALTSQVLTSISQMERICEQSNTQLYTQYKKNFKELIKKCKELHSSREDLKNTVEHHGESINTLKNHYGAVSNTCDKQDLCLAEMKKNISELQKSSYRAETEKGKSMNTPGESLTDLLSENKGNENNVSWIVLLLLAGSILISVTAFYIR